MVKPIGEYKARTWAEKLQVIERFPRGEDLLAAIEAFHAAIAAAADEPERAAIRAAFVREFGLDAPDI